MTTSTLELVDWATILDDEPACESVHGCDHRAASRVRYACGCSVLFCADCTKQVVSGWSRRAYPLSIRCGDCKRLVRAKCPSELLTVVPL